jgi:hypothetical protein
MGGADGCARCGTPLAPGARFCANCGVSASQGPAALSTNERVGWFLGGGAVVAVVGGLALFATRGQTAAPPAAAAASEAPFAAGGGGGGTPPDISNMTPRERFDRLFDRIMRAAESGDEATVTNFAPMAVSAYGMLTPAEMDNDARYDAALIKLHTGEVDGAAALADTILKQQPGHLFGIILQGTIARFKKDDKGLKKSYADYLGHYDAETKAKRPEYEKHARSIEQFLKDARDASGKT